MQCVDKKKKVTKTKLLNVAPVFIKYSVNKNVCISPHSL